VEYRNLRKQVLPQEQKLITDLKAESKAKDFKITNLESEVARLESIMNNNEQDIDNLRSALKQSDEVIKKQIRRINKFKFFTYSLGAATIVLGGVVLIAAL
jgi:peptidoglycan hydrolase CwlO-like protein